MYRLLALFALAAAGYAQLPGPNFPLALSQYLSLTDQQILAIVKANTDYTRFTAEKQLRAAQVQREIAEETNRNTVDPMALGLRYTELESIRRELADRLTQTRQAVAAVLTDAQKQKIKALEDALKLQPVISEAQCENLLTPAPTTGYASFLLGYVGSTTGVIAPAPLCGQFRTGSFTFTPAPVQP
jgi:hypothetical protein